jgi:pilus assembly protein Flp/PilA
MKRIIASFIRGEEGATAIEYGLLAALISVGGMAAMTLVGTKISTAYSTVGSALS